MQRVGLIVQLYVVVVVLLLIVHNYRRLLFCFLYPKRILVDHFCEHGQRQNGVLSLQNQTVRRPQLSWNEFDIYRFFVFETVLKMDEERWEREMGRERERTEVNTEEVSIRLDCPIKLHRSRIVYKQPLDRLYSTYLPNSVNLFDVFLVRSLM